MSNSFFKFKQFTIQQDQCAMKVCTDACLFGAIIASDSNKYPLALDIGTGTGLLSLMFAQKHTESTVDTIEIDSDAFKQAQQNIDAVEFENRIKLLNDDIRFFKSDQRYDLIFSNPPFYAKDLKSTNDKRNLALHSTSLSFFELLNKVNELLKPEGLFFVLIPYSVESTFLKIANEMCLFENQIIRFKQSSAHDYFRSVIIISKINKEVLSSEIVIKESNGEYSSELKKLLKDYYLFL